MENKNIQYMDKCIKHIGIFKTGLEATEMKTTLCRIDQYY